MSDTISKNGQCLSVDDYGVGPGARLFVTKCYGWQPIDFQKLAAAGFTAVVWYPADVPSFDDFVDGAASAGLDALLWKSWPRLSDVGPSPELVTRVDKSSDKYARPLSQSLWSALTDTLVEIARMAVERTNIKGVILDLECYEANLCPDGFAESYDSETIGEYLETRFPHESARRATRGEILRDCKRRNVSNFDLLFDYAAWHRERARTLAERLREAIDAVNPRFQIGVYGGGTLSAALKEGVATCTAPVIECSAETYGRTLYPYQWDKPDLPALKGALVTNAVRARQARRRPYPVVFLGGHNPGPWVKEYASATVPRQVAFAARQAFNSAAYSDGYWVWTETVPTDHDWKSHKEKWIEDVLTKFGAANAALDAHDHTWVNRQPLDIAYSGARRPSLILTTDRHKNAVSAWNPLTGERVVSAWDPTSRSAAVLDKDALEKVVWSCQSLRGGELTINGHAAELVDAHGHIQRRFVAGHGLCCIALGDVDGVDVQDVAPIDTGEMEVVTLNSGKITVWDAETGVALLRFHVGSDQAMVAVDTRFTLAP